MFITLTTRGNNRIQLLTNAGHGQRTDKQCSVHPLNSRRTRLDTRHVQHPHASMSSRLRAGQMQHIRSRLGRAVTTRARHTHTAQARLRTRPGTQSASPRVVAGPHLAPVVHTAVQSQLRSFDEPSPRSRLTTIRGHLLQSPCIVPASVLLSVAPHVSALSPNRMQYAPSTHRAGAPDPALLNVALPGPHTISAA